MPRNLLQLMSPFLALRDILLTLNRQVRFGSEADVNGRAGLCGSVVIDPKATSPQRL